MLKRGERKRTYNIFMEGVALEDNPNQKGGNRRRKPTDNKDIEQEQEEEGTRGKIIKTHSRPLRALKSVC